MSEGAKPKKVLQIDNPADQVVRTVRIQTIATHKRRSRESSLSPPATSGPLGTGVVFSMYV